MKSFLIRAAVAALVVTVMAAPVLATPPLTHPPFDLRQAYPCATCPSVRFAGFSGALPAAACALPGFFDIDPGVNWANFVTAKRSLVAYTIKTISLTKITPSIVQCADVFTAHTCTQTGTNGIRLRWPLMYELPGTVWTLTITYGTSTAVKLPGEPTAGYVHQDVWQWVVSVGVDDVKALLVLFHELPFGLDEVPLVSDELLYPVLQAKLDQLNTALTRGNRASAAAILSDFELEVMDACIMESPGKPLPTGPGTGIANSFENPACCKLLADAEALLMRL